MSIITKPSVTKGTPAQFTLNKSELLQHSLVQADPYFSDSLNWYRVNLVYKSTTGSQYEIVEFDASQATPTGTFLISEKARDEFQIQKVQIMDFDGGFLEIPRSSLSTSDFDVLISESNSNLTPIIFPTSTPGFTKLANGGLQSTGGTSLTLPNYITTSDFTLIFKFNDVDAVYDAFYGAFSGTHMGFRIWNNKIEAYLGSPRTQPIDILPSNTLQVSKVGNLFTWTINNVVVHTEISPGFAAPYDLFIRPQANGVLREAYLVN